VQVSVQGGFGWGFGLVAGGLLFAIGLVMFVINRSSRKPRAVAVGRAGQQPGAPIPSRASYRLISRSPGSAQQWPLQGTYVSVGRLTGNDIVLEQMDVSRKHGVFEFDGNSWLYRDVSASTASLYNGQELQGTTRLQPGDVLTLGSVELEFARL